MDGHDIISLYVREADIRVSETRLQIGVGLGCVSSIKKNEFADFHMLQKNASGAWLCCYDLLCP